MLKLESIHRLLAIADSAKDPYVVADIGAELLAANPNDPVAAAAYCQALRSLKLHDPASLGPPTHPSSASARPSPAAGGTVPWASRGRRFSANLAALKERDPGGAALVRAAADDLCHYELHLAGDGNFQILDTTLPLHKGWLAGLINHKATEAFWPRDPEDRMLPPPALFEGLGFGWLFLHALQITERGFLNHRRPFYVVERDPLALAMLLHMHDLREAVCSPRVRWFIGDQDERTVAALCAALRGNPGWTLPDVFVRSFLRPHVPLKLEAALQGIAEERKAQRNAWMAEAKAYYDGKDAAYWAERFRGAGKGQAPLRVLGVTSRYTTVLQYAMEELRQAASAATGADACEMRVAIEPDDSSHENPFIEMIAAFKPDLIVQISRMRYENPWTPRNVPFLCWDQDNLPCMRTPEATASLDEFTYVAGNGAVYGHTFLNWPRKNVVFCHSAAATFRYGASAISPELLAKHACDISFISNASGTPEEVRDRSVAQWRRSDGAAAAVFERASAAILARMEGGATWDFHSLRELLAQSSMALEIRLSDHIVRELTMGLIPLADRCFRHAALHWVRRWCQANDRTFRLYGQGWERHPDFSPFAAGYARQGEELAAIYRASKINLQLMESVGFLHSRPLDGVAAGGFFLTRRTLADGVGSKETAALYALARWSHEHGVTDEATISASDSPEVRNWWTCTQAYFDRHGVRPALMQALEVWAQMPPACAAIPHLAEVTFATEQEFSALAMRYLADEAQRTRVASDMREVVEHTFSHRQRWELFLAAVRQGLAAGTELLAAR